MLCYVLHNFFTNHQHFLYLHFGTEGEHFLSRQCILTQKKRTVPPGCFFYVHQMAWETDPRFFDTSRDVLCDLAVFWPLKLSGSVTVLSFYRRTSIGSHTFCVLPTFTDHGKERSYACDWTSYKFSLVPDCWRALTTSHVVIQQMLVSIFFFQIPSEAFLLS